MGSEAEESGLIRQGGYVMAGNRKGTLVSACVSVPTSRYIAPDSIGGLRAKARKAGHRVRSAKRNLRFDGVTLSVTVVTVRNAPTVVA